MAEFAITRKKKVATDFFKVNYNFLESQVYLAMKKSVVRVVYKLWTELPDSNIINDSELEERYDWPFDKDTVDASVEFTRDKVIDLLIVIRDNINETVYTPRLCFDFGTIFNDQKIVPKGFLFQKEIERLEFSYEGLFKNVDEHQLKLFLVVFIFIKVFIKKVLIVPGSFSKSLMITPRIRLNFKIIASILSYYVHAYLVSEVKIIDFDVNDTKLVRKAIVAREKSNLDPEAPLNRSPNTHFFADELSEGDLRRFLDAVDNEYIMELMRNIADNLYEKVYGNKNAGHS